MRRLDAPSFFGLLVFAVARAAFAADPEPAWTPGDEVRGEGYAFQIFSREQADGLVVYQARGHAAATPDALVEAVWAVTTDPDSVPDGQTRRVLESDDAGFTVHTAIDLPALFSDRDIVTRGETAAPAADGARRIDWKAIDHEAAPQRDGTIRIQRSAGFWEFTPDGERSRLVYESYVDLGGSLPAWVVQPIMGGTIGGTVEDVAQRAMGR